MISAIIPQTPLGFIFYVTWDAPYRMEMHHDIRDALTRFGVTPKYYDKLRKSEPQFPEWATFEAFRNASFEIERAAYGVRHQGAPKLRRLTDDDTMMPGAAVNLFEQLRPVLAYEMAHGRPTVSAGERKRVLEITLLSHVLWSFYDPTYEGALPAFGRIPRGRTTWLPIELPQVCETPDRELVQLAWTSVTAMLNSSEPPSFDDALKSAELAVVCHALAFEYDWRDWMWCW